VFLVYSIADRNTFNHLSEWLEEFYEKGSKEAFVFLVGTKSDLKSRVSAEEAF
jgi:GTPase SAR1 family protein